MKDERMSAMRVNCKFGTIVLVAGMALSTTVFAQSATNGQASAQMQGEQATWPVDQLITSSVHDAWVLSGRNEEKFFAMVSELAQISAQKRGVTLPNTEDAGKRFGELVKSLSKGNHDQLLYVVVDQAVQKVGTKS
jgi:hypothetical protein